MKARQAYPESLVQDYDHRHFGGKSGQYIFRQECRALEALLGAPQGLMLDIPCGTGIYVQACMETERATVVAADASVPMLEATGRRGIDARRVLCDSNRLPFKEGTFDAVLTIRLFSHYPPGEVAQMLLEMKRAIRPSGRVVFDTFRWTPRQWPLLRRFLDQSVIHVLGRRDVEEIIQSTGLRLVDLRSLHLFSPLWLRKLPLWLLRALTTVERRMPQRWLLRTLWACTQNQERMDEPGAEGSSSPSLVSSSRSLSTGSTPQHVIASEATSRRREAQSPLNHKKCSGQ
jgi:ubiquinone/menaquinone biosynthesis C-methylase UbiE